MKELLKKMLNLVFRELPKQIRKSSKNKLSFESPETLLDYVFIICKDFEDQKWTKYTMHQFKILIR